VFASRQSHNRGKARLLVSECWTAYDAFGAALVQPTLVFQGLQDRSVDARTVEQFARGRTNVTLSLLDDDHQLLASLPRIWNDVAPFLGAIE